MFTKEELGLLDEVLSCRIMDCDDVLSDKVTGESEKEEWGRYRAELTVLQNHVKEELKHV